MLDNNNQALQNNSNNQLMKVYYNKNDVRSAYNAILAYGYSEDDVSVLMNEETRNKHFVGTDIEDLAEPSLETKSVEGMGIGSAIGASIGGIAAAIAAIGTALVIPGLGLIVAGPIAAGLAGVGAGGMAGGLVGTLVGLGISSDKTKEYEDAINKGGILVGVKTKSADDYKLLESALNNLSNENASRLDSVI